MNTGKRPRPSGTAKVTVREQAARIQADLDRGWTVRTIYDRHIEPLEVMSYRQFARYVQRMRQRAAADDEPLRAPPRPVFRTPAAASPIAPRSPETSSPAQPENNGAPHHVENRPRVGSTADGRTFAHDPHVRDGDYERLFGSRRKS